MHGIAMNECARDAAAMTAGGGGDDSPTLPDDELLAVLVCPRDGMGLKRASDAALACPCGHEFPVVDGVPVLLLPEADPTIAVAAHSVRVAQRPARDGEAALHLDTLGITEDERRGVLELRRRGTSVDPVVQFLVAATCGTAYRGARGALLRYPVPELPLPDGAGRVLVDVGCNWGRWSIAAARKGYRVIGIDPQLGAVLAGRRVARQLGLRIAFVCADARFLPLRRDAADVVYSYSVLQHFSPADCIASVAEIRRVLQPGGVSMIQMANALGLRNVYQQLRRRFRAGAWFDVRYYRPTALKRIFRVIGPSSVSADAFLGLGLHAGDADLYPFAARTAVRVSEVLKRACQVLPGLRFVADSVYVRSVKS